MKTALTQLSGIGDDDVDVVAFMGEDADGNPTVTYRVTFIGDLFNTDVSELRAFDLSLFPPVRQEGLQQAAAALAGILVPEADPADAFVHTISGMTIIQGFQTQIEVTTQAEGEAGTNEEQTVTIVNPVPSGFFELMFGGQKTVPIAHDATAAQVQAALVALANIGQDNVSVSGDLVYTSTDVPMESDECGAERADWFDEDTKQSRDENELPSERTLRGYRYQRLTGDAALYAGAEVRALPVRPPA